VAAKAPDSYPWTLPPTPFSATANDGWDDERSLVYGRAIDSTLITPAPVACAA
jgi:hypothetical protein